MYSVIKRRNDAGRDTKRNLNSAETRCAKRTLGGRSRLGGGGMKRRYGEVMGDGEYGCASWMGWIWNRELTTKGRKRNK